MSFVYFLQITRTVNVFIFIEIRCYYFYLWNKEKGIFNSRKTATVKVYVCPECGYIELRAEKPKDLVLKK